FTMAPNIGRRLISHMVAITVDSMDIEHIPMDAMNSRLHGEVQKLYNLLPSQICIPILAKIFAEAICLVPLVLFHTIGSLVMTVGSNFVPNIASSMLDYCHSTWHDSTLHRIFKIFAINSQKNTT